MKNIDKYTNTKDAIEAYDEWSEKGSNHCISFYGWCKLDYIEPREPTLLEAAKTFVNCVEMPSVPQERKHWDGLCAAIERESQKPVRNCDKYATAKNAMGAYRAMCKNLDCKHCRFGSRKGIEDCIVSWLYAAAEKEDAE